MGRAVRPMIEALLDGQRDKIVSAADAVRLIRPCDTVATGGFVGIGFAEAIAVALGRAA
jgi:propionate CoA-transferase